MLKPFTSVVVRAIFVSFIFTFSAPRVPMHSRIAFLDFGFFCEKLIPLPLTASSGYKAHDIASARDFFYGATVLWIFHKLHFYFRRHDVINLSDNVIIFKPRGLGIIGVRYGYRGHYGTTESG